MTDQQERDTEREAFEAWCLKHANKVDANMLLHRRGAGYSQTAVDGMWAAWNARAARSQQQQQWRLPKEPPPGLLTSMAIRSDHGLGVPGYYDELATMGLTVAGVSHAKRMEATLRVMRQLYEEVSGHGFYSPEKEADYAAMIPPALSDLTGGGNG